MSSYLPSKTDAGRMHFAVVYFVPCKAAPPGLSRSCIVSTTERNTCTDSAFSAAIYFDGSLPAYKHPERLQRLQQQVNLLQSYKFRTRPTAKKNQAPAPAFLVAAAIESLTSSRFKHVVHIVRGEADPYCAALARAIDGVVFTGDSDLLVHDLGPCGAVVYFSSIQTQLGLPDIPVRAVGYWPAQIIQDLGVKGSLVPLAFAIQKDCYRPLKSSVSASRGYDQKTDEYIAFSQQYVAIPQHSIPKDPTFLHSELAIIPHYARQLRAIDPRLSELIVSALDNKEDHACLSIYLPFLTEDPERAAAWNIGKPSRTLAYSILLSSHASTRHGIKVKEHIRRSQRIAEHIITPLSAAEIIPSSPSIANTFHNLTSPQPSLSIEKKWRLFSLFTLCTALLEQDKPVPSKALLISLLSQRRSQSSPPASQRHDQIWSHTHLSAQFEAAIYSLRILKQCSLVFLGLGDAPPSGNANSTISPKLYESVKDLNDTLSSLPALSQVFDIRSDTDADSEEDMAAIDMLLRVLDVSGLDDGSVLQKKDETSSASGGTNQKKRKSRKRGKKPQSEEDSETMEDEAGGVQANNMFFLLSQGDVGTKS